LEDHSLNALLRKFALFGTPQGRMRLLMHLPNFFKLYWRLLRDRRISPLPKAILLAGVAYFVMPLDMFPDFPLVGLGWTDDIIVLALACKLFISLSPRHVVEEHVRLIDEGA
jgi:uncharacterized membrane protein YkvA (DUF1232 family)